MIFKIFLASLLLCSSYVSAEILDPNNLLPQVRAFLGSQTLSQAYACGDSADMDVFRISCEYFRQEDGVTGAVCTDVANPAGARINRLVYNCTPGSVSFLIDLTGDSTDLTSAQFEAGFGNVAETFLEDAGVFSGYLKAVPTITAVENTNYTLGRSTGNPYQVPALNIIGRLGEPGYESYPFVVTVIQNVPGVAQLVRYRLNDVTWFKVDGFTRSTESRP